MPHNNARRNPPEPRFIIFLKSLRRLPTLLTTMHVEHTQQSTHCKNLRPKNLSTRARQTTRRNFSQRKWPTTNTANQLNFEASILGLVTLRSRQRARKWIPYTYDLAFAERTKSGAATEGGAPKAEPVYFALAHSTCPFLLLKAR